MDETMGIMVCAVTLNNDIGVDVEYLYRQVDHLALAQRFFTFQEAEILAALPADERAKRFFFYWTLKEAYLKARGQGISLGLDHISIHNISISDNSATQNFTKKNHIDTWDFFIPFVNPDYQVAVAIKNNYREPKILTCHQFTFTEPE